MALTIASGSFQFTEGSSPSTSTNKILFNSIQKGAICLWERINAFPDQSKAVFLFESKFANKPTIQAFPQLQTVYTVSGTTTTVTNQNPILLNTPTHIAFTWDQTVPVQNVYTNGVLTKTTNISGSLPVIANAPIAIGVHFNNAVGTGIANQFSASFQDLVIYSGYTPTQNDITLLVNRLALPTQIGPTGPSGAIAWYTLYGPAGSSAKLYNVGMTNSGYMVGTNLYFQNLPNTDGVTPTGIAIYDNSNFVYTYNISLTGAYISTCSGLAVFLFNQTNTNNYSYNNALIKNPSITITYPGYNNTIVLNNAISSVSCPWIMFPLPSAIPANSVVTYNIPTGMVSTSLGIINGSTGYMVNNIGKDVFPYPISDNMMVGFNLLSDPIYFNYFIFKNYAFKGVGNNYSVANIVTWGDDQQPFSSNGIVQFPFFWTQSNGVDNKGLPFITGLWNTIWQDDPVNSSLVNIFTSFAAGKVNFSNGTFTSVVISGVRYSQQPQFITYANTGATWNPELGFQIIPYNTGSIHVNNLWIIPPENSLDTSNPGALEQNIIDKISTSSGKFCPIIRAMGPLGTNNSNLVVPGHILPITGFTWGRVSSSQTITPTIVRPYDLSISPSAYFDQYGWIFPSSINYLYTSNANTFYCFEVVTSGNHGLYTGQNLTLNVTPTNLAVTGTNGSQQIVLDTLNLFDYNIVVTGPSSFVFYAFNRKAAALGGPNIVTLRDTFTSGFSFNLNLIAHLGQRFIPPEAHVRACAQISGCICWYNVPHLATDATATAMAQNCVANYPSGRKMIVEYSNEHWNNGFLQNIYFYTLADIAGSSIDQVYTLRSNQIHNIFDSVFTAAGRPNSIIRLFGGQYHSPSVLQNVLNTALANNIKVDAVAVAPYLNNSTDPSILYAINSGSMTNTHEVFRHFIWYDTNYQSYGSNLLSYVNSYEQSAGSNVEIYGYEGSIQAPTINSYSGALTLHDFNYHPENYRTTQHYLRYLQNSLNMTKFCYFQLEDGLSAPDTSWNFITHPSQTWGRGDGSDGKAINKFALSDNLPHDLENVSPSLLAWKDYINNNTGIPSYAVNPTVASYNPTTNINTTGSLLTIQFSKAIVPSSVSITLYNNAGAVVGSTNNVTNFTASISATGTLLQGVNYNIVVSGLQDTIGMSQLNTYSLTFNTLQNTYALTITPTPTGSNISIITPIYVIFNAPIQTGTLNFSVIGSGLSIPGVLVSNTGLYKETFSNTWPLNLNTNYVATLSGIKDSQGNILPVIQWPFMTQTNINGSVNPSKYIVTIPYRSNISNIEIILE